VLSGHGRSFARARVLRVLAIAAVLPVAVFAGPSAAFASITTPVALGVATAIGASGTTITGASWAAKPAHGTPDGISDASLDGFPTDGSTFAVLTTGDVNDAPTANNDPGTGTKLDDFPGLNVRGDKDFDVSILKIDFTVGERMNCLSFDFRFLSEEFGPPTFTSAYNDSFIAELDTPPNTGWKTSGSSIVAPNNFAFDANGHPITILSLGDTSMSAAEADGTTYDGATQILTANSPVTSGAHSLYLSIFDNGDQLYDSAVFLDNLVVGHAADPKVQCVKGAEPKGFDLALAPATGTHPVGGSHTVTATVTDLDGGAVAAGKAVVFAASGANTAAGTGTTNASGQAAFSYTGTAVGTDSISACYDVNGNSACDGGEPFASVEASWTAATSATPLPGANDVILPKTGRPVGVIAGIGGLAVLLGAVAIFLVRRRRVERVIAE